MNKKLLTLALVVGLATQLSGCVTGAAVYGAYKVTKFAVGTAIDAASGPSEEEKAKAKAEADAKKVASTPAPKVEEPTAAVIPVAKVEVRSLDAQPVSEEAKPEPKTLDVLIQEQAQAPTSGLQLEDAGTSTALGPVLDETN